MSGVTSVCNVAGRLHYVGCKRFRTKGRGFLRDTVSHYHTNQTPHGLRFRSAYFYLSSLTSVRFVAAEAM